MSFKRNNASTSNGNMEQILVGSGNQALAAGALVNATTSLGIADGQLGVLSWDFDGVTALGNFIPAATTSSDVTAIKVLQGTPNSATTQNADVWEVGDKAYVESGIIHREGIRSVATTSFRLPAYSAYAVTDLPAAQSETEYGFFVYLDSVRNDRDWSDNDEVISDVFTTEDLTGVVNGDDLVIQNVLYRLNFRSKLASLSNAGFQNGNRDVLGLAINTAGGAGQALGTITCGTVIPVMDDNGVITNVVADESMIIALANVIKAQADAVAGGATITNQITTASTIETIDLSTAGTVAAGAGNAASNAMIFLGLHQDQAAYFDNIKQITTDIDVNLSLGFRADTFVQTKTAGDEGNNLGRHWTVEDQDRANIQTHTMQTTPFGEFFSRGKTYVDPALNYTATIIDYYDFENTLTVSQQRPKQLIILLASTAACVDVATAVTNLATGAAMPSTTTDAATVASLEAILGAWLDDARTYSAHALKGESAVGANFV